MRLRLPTEYTYDTLGNLVLETSKNKSVDYEYNELNQLVKKVSSQHAGCTCWNRGDVID